MRVRRWVAAVAIVLGAAFVMPARVQVVLPQRADRSVHDLAGVLSAQTVPTLEHFHRELFDKTGVAIVVVTVPTLDGEPVSDFAVRVGDEWGVGRQGEDRGIVIAVAVAERDTCIATGYGVEGYLPDGRVGGIIDSAIPVLGQSDYSTGVLQISAALVEASAAEYGVAVEGTAVVARPVRGTPTGPGSQGRGLLGLLGLLVMGYLFFRHPTLFFLLMFSGMGRGGGGFRGGGFGGGGGFEGVGGGGFGGGGAGRGF